MNLKTFNADVFDEKTVNFLCTTKPEMSYKKIFDNKRLVDTAGFVPLNVRIKQFLLSGEQAKLSSEMFDSDDWRYMFEHVNDNSLEVGDDIEDVNRKLQIVIARQNELLARKAGSFSDVPDGTDENERSEKKGSEESTTGKSPADKA